MFFERVIGVLLAAVVAGAVAQPQAARAQAAQGRKPVSAEFTKAANQAKETGQPLVVFGLSDGCSRCQALKQGLTTNNELKLLLTQYVAAEVPFAGADFRAILDGMVRQDRKFNVAIGAPSVFIFTAKGEALYAGPSREAGMAADDEFKKLLISGIEKNGGVRSPSAGGASSTTLAADLAKARKLLGENQTLAAAAILARHVRPAADTSEQISAIVELTGLAIARSKSEQQLDALVKEVSDKGRVLVESATKLTAAGDVRGAVQLAELGRVLHGFPAFAEKFDAAWSEALTAAKAPQLREQAELIDEARQAEGRRDLIQAIQTYERVVTMYPETQAAELCQRRIAQLREVQKPAPR